MRFVHNVWRLVMGRLNMRDIQKIFVEISGVSRLLDAQFLVGSSSMVGLQAPLASWQIPAGDSGTTRNGKPSRIVAGRSYQDPGLCVGLTEPKRACPAPQLPRSKVDLFGKCLRRYGNSEFSMSMFTSGILGAPTLCTRTLNVRCKASSSASSVIWTYLLPIWVMEQAK